MTNEKPNIYQRLNEASKLIVDIFKVKPDTVNFKVTPASLVSEKVKIALEQSGIFLKTEIVESRYEILTQKTKFGERQLYQTHLTMNYTFVNIDNPSDTCEIKNWYGTFAMDNLGASYGATLTYTRKNFLINQFNIVTDEDDPDFKAHEPIEIVKPKPVQQTKQVYPPQKETEKPIYNPTYDWKKIKVIFDACDTLDQLKQDYAKAIDTFPGNKQEIAELKDKAKLNIEMNINFNECKTKIENAKSLDEAQIHLDSYQNSVDIDQVEVLRSLLALKKTADQRGIEIIKATHKNR